MPVLSVTESQRIDLAGTLEDVYEVVFSVGSRPGVFTVTVPKGENVVAAAAAAIGTTIEDVNAIYSITT